MTRDDILRLALNAHLLNYVDNETPRRYFIPADADVEEVELFAALVAAEKDKEIERLREALRDIAISENSMYQESRAKQALGEDQNIWRMCGVNTDDVIKMADEAGIVMSLTDDRVTLNKLNRFLELHLKTLIQDGYRKCSEGQQTTQFCGLLEQAVRAEREACAELCQEMEDRENPYERNVAVLDCASAIRARGEP